MLEGGPAIVKSVSIDVVKSSGAAVCMTWAKRRGSPERAHRKTLLRGQMPGGERRRETITLGDAGARRIDAL